MNEKEKTPTSVGANRKTALRILKTRSEHIIKAGSLVSSDDFGDGVVVGFSNITENPLVYFYDYDKLIGVNVNSVRPGHAKINRHCNLRQISTEDLVKELVKRKSEVAEAGIYKDYLIKRKYSNDRSPVRADAVLIVNYLDKV